MDLTTATRLRDEGLSRAQQLLDTAEAENRDLTSEERTEHAACLERVRTGTTHLQILEASKDPKRTVPPNGSAPAVNTRTAGKPWEVRDWRDTDELRGRAEVALERMGVEDAAAARALSIIDAQERSRSESGDLARRIVSTMDPAYERAWGKMILNPLTGPAGFTTTEREAWERTLSVGTAADGGYAVPAHLDPSLVITNDGTSNAIRKLARKVTLPVGNTWNGLSSAGVSASFDAELSQVSDDSPTLGQPSIDVHMARLWVEYSIEAGEDITNLTSELARLFADAKDRLEEEKFAQGTGTGEPKGVFTAVYATTACRVTSTTAATIGLVDLQSVYKTVAARHRRKGTWLTHADYSMEIRALGTALSASFSGDLRDSTEGAIFGRPLVESDDAPNTVTTTALDSRVLFGDFSTFCVVDKVGMSIEPVPHVFSTTNNRPKGARGLWAHWRVGSDVVSSTAPWALLCDKTSA